MPKAAAEKTELIGPFPPSSPKWMEFLLLADHLVPFPYFVSLLRDMKLGDCRVEVDPISLL